MTKGLRERINDGEFVVCAEGYLFEFERRGYLKAGSYVPEVPVVVDHPEMVKALHEEFVHAGSDVVEAFTYYAIREKLRLIGREQDLEPMNRKALRIAKEVAERTNTLMAGNLSNTTVYIPDDPKTHEKSRDIFIEGTKWAVEEGADLIIAETIGDFGEAKLALDVIKQYGNGLPAVINLATNSKKVTRDGVPLIEALKKLKDHGADVVGINCLMGPVPMIQTMKEMREGLPNGVPLAALPVPYRTENDDGMLYLKVPHTGKQAFPSSLDYFYVSDDQIRSFGEAAKESNVQFVGLCCGNSSRYTRSLAESVGRSPEASKFSPDMSKHWIFGQDKSFKEENLAFRNSQWVGKTKE